MRIYTDFGPPALCGQQAIRYADRPFCDSCGPFRGRYLRRLDAETHVCRDCDEYADDTQGTR
jgi:hypothetical protein